MVFILTSTFIACFLPTYYSIVDDSWIENILVEPEPPQDQLEQQLLNAFLQFLMNNSNSTTSNGHHSHHHTILTTLSPTTKLTNQVHNI